MTRLAALADIHGNLPALQAVSHDMARFDVERVVVAGDSVNWGPFSREVMEFISARGWAVIRGNNELYALDFETPRMPAHWATFTMPPILREQLGAEWLGNIACLPDELCLRFLDAPPIRVVHGLPGNPFQAIYPSTSGSAIRAWLADVPESTLICAHSHIAIERRVERWQIFNPGSVGIPLDGELSASYMILDGGEAGWQLVAHRRVPFSNAANFERFEAQRYAERGGVTARLIIDELRQGRLRLHPYLIWKNATHPDQPDSVELMNEFLHLADLRDFILPDYQNLAPALYRD